MSQPGSEAVGGPGRVIATDASTHVTGETLCVGVGRGEVLRLDEPLSLWGGTDLATGLIIDVHHPQHGISIAGRVLVMTASRGSSSSSSVLAEQIRAGVAPAAILLGSRDAILTLGAIAAAEVYEVFLPMVLMDAAEIASVPASGPVDVHATPDEASVSW